MLASGIIRAGATEEMSLGRLFYPKPFIESDARLTFPQRKEPPPLSDLDKAVTGCR
ncbi:MAG: hypothetical protein BECKG1743F_GA0114225_101462 [Candidatus Kentron sp. G]|nr:MAG: hypothetical protein BECKG1743F_GA0114225_101462 [Candidatus Kentron sp. G]